MKLIPGGGGEILVDEIRKKRRTHCNSEEWLAVMDAAHSLGIPTTATMMFGYGETRDHRGKAGCLVCIDLEVRDAEALPLLLQALDDLIDAPI